MLGIIHRDTEVRPLLYQWMNAWDPDVVTLEFSPYGFAFRKSNSAELKNRVLESVEGLRAEGRHVDDRVLDDVLAYIDLPPEFIVASDFADSRGIPFYLIDMDTYSRTHLSHLDKLIDRENLANLLYAPNARNHRQEKALARLAFEGGVRLFSYTEEMQTRDRHMKERIAALMKIHDAPRLLLHVCGWQHLADPHGLYASLDPVKVFIHDKTLRV